MAKTHPLVKMAIVFILSISGFILTSYIDLLVLLFFNIILILILKIPVFSKQFRKVIIAFFFMNVSIFIAWSLFSERPGNIIFYETTIILIENKWIWHVLITDITLISAGTISLRAIIMFLLMLFFFTSVSDRDLIYGLRSIKVPFALCLLINLTFRGLTMFQQEYSTVKEAMMTRGMEFKRISIPKRINNFIMIFMTLIVLMFKKTEDIANSIEARGIPFRSKNRTIYQFYPLKKKDYFNLLLLLLFLIVSIFARLTNNSLILLFLNIFA
ncbi:MAG: energy-coupling factor transporter transmembrane component T family protein [Promethearchaeota archaeon]